MRHDDLYTAHLADKLSNLNKHSDGVLKHIIIPGIKYAVNHGKKDTQFWFTEQHAILPETFNEIVAQLKKRGYNICGEYRDRNIIVSWRMNE